MKYLYWAIAGLLIGILTMAMMPSFINWSTRGELDMVKWGFDGYHGLAEVHYFQVGGFMMMGFYMLIFVIVGIIVDFLSKKK
jgi:uncharacterized membrane-anchored protein YhcB (DUF1043 family)